MVASGTDHRIGPARPNPLGMATAFLAAPADEVKRRAQAARAMLECCTLCEKRCGANRLDPARSVVRAACGLGEETHCFKRHVSLAEETRLLPSYMVYFAGCNFRCAFCVQAPECFDPDRGPKVDAASLSHVCSNVVARGAKSINLLGGEPSLHLHTILELSAAALEDGQVLPLVLNSNFYMTPHVLDLLEGVATVYLADLKFGPGSCATAIAGVQGYWDIVTRNLVLAHEQCLRTGALLMVRHLVMPGHVECCTRPVLEWMRRELPDTDLHVMESYVPAWRASSDPKLGRLTTHEESQRVVELTNSIGGGR